MKMMTQYWPTILTIFTFGFFVNALSDVQNNEELLIYNVRRALGKTDITIVYDESKAEVALKFVKIPLQEGIPFSYVHFSKFVSNGSRNNCAKQIVVLCNYSNMEPIVRKFTRRKMMVLPYVWVFVTEDDLAPMFEDDNLGSIMAVSNKNKTVTLYSKGCRGLGVTRFPDVALETLRSFEDLLRDLRPLKGCTLSVVLLEHKPLSWYDGEKAEGYDVDALKVLTEVTEQKLLFVKSKDNMFGELTSTGWTGNLGVIERNEQDTAVPFFMLTKQRSSYFETSDAMHISYWVGLVKAKPIFSATGVFKPFSLGIWMIVASTATCLAICYSLASKLSLYSWGQRDFKEYVMYFLDKAFHAWTAFLQQESRPKEDFTSGRLLLLTISITSLIVLTAYSSVLYAVLSSTELDIPFRSIELFVEHGKFKPLFESTALAMGINSNSKLKSFRDLSVKLLEPCGQECLAQTHREAMDIVDNQKGKVYFLIKDAALVEVEEGCKSAIAIDNAAIATFHIHWRTGYVHARYMDRFIRKIRENGILSRIYKDTVHSKTCHHFHDDGLGMEIIYLPFLIIGLGAFVSLLLLVFEILLYRSIILYDMNALA